MLPPLRFTHFGNILLVSTWVARFVLFRLWGTLIWLPSNIIIPYGPVTSLLYFLPLSHPSLAVSFRKSTRKIGMMLMLKMRSSNPGIVLCLVTWRRFYPS
ncbi:hypothetical protein BGZ60DRAFT_406317 [Tricladium varicosporioides]|nr:hypothetical protein BGZ60DRAFT_406317 [Hymenoscyphus varicosporioides]